jgi:crotonobetainyl-CoA:carnitine CoA-transferase CaiB-like acyl-CoA transferase
MLAELGADVIKIEDPRGGDPMRQLPPLVDGRGVFDLLLNRGKRSVVLDLKDPEARASLDRLIARTDVVIESFRPSTARRLGVAGEQIRAKHPHVIHCSITGYGQTGPYAELPGHDLNYVSISGMLAADRPDPTVLPHVFIADIGGGAMSAVIGILAALVGRARDGEGRAIDISMHEAALYWVMLPAARELVDGGREATDELPTFGRHACYNVYRTKEGELIALGALELKFWKAFCDAVGRPDLTLRHLTDPVDQTRLLAEVRQIFLARTRDEWLAFFRGHDVCLTPVNSPSDAMRDSHIAARGVVQAVRGGRAILPPFVTETPDLRPAPTLGEHTDEVLESWGS